jgi:outer membrane protein OmpA-like peptidoglycan-associated protein
MRRFAITLAMMMSVLIISNKQSMSQEYMPFAQSNYAGVSGLVIQPASIVDSRYIFDMTLFGGDFSASNNYLALKRGAMYTPGVWDDENFGTKYVYRHFNGKDKSGAINLSLMLPSFMVNISDNTAIAFSSRTRGVVNFDNVTEEFAFFLSESFDYDPLLNQTLTNSNLNIQAHLWSEFGLTFANVIPLNTEEHFLKGGITLKYLQGLASGYAFVENLSFRLDGRDSLSLFQSDINYGLSGNFDNGVDPFDFVSDPGFGMDIGFVYEYRPNIAKYKYDMDGREGLLRPDVDKYLLRVGISLLDLGKINYLKGFYSQDFTADVRNWDLSTVEINSVEALNDTLRNRFNFSDLKKETFATRMPTALSIQIDYNVAERFYINFSPFIALRKGTSVVTKAHYFTTFSLTPRYDHKWFGAALPIQADEFGRLRAGLALRLGPIWVGSNSFITNSLASKTYNTDAYFMLKIPVFRHIPRDSDKDAVSNKEDLCPKIPGIWAMKGCPDSDSDGITDDMDECPSLPGPAELKGCPDRDGDGIADKDDRCPDHPGTIALGGCPDTDNDGIIDPEDECPDQAGTAIMKGCPDRDNDGIADHQDECPDHTGTVAMRGCPDRDNDGVADKNDKCPDVAGKPEHGGCPFADYDKDGVADEMDKCPATPGPVEFEGCPDTDGDGVHDGIDFCPKTPGPAENNGCPVIEKEEKEVLARAFSDLEFETGKAVIKAVSYPSLNELATLLKTKEGWNVMLSGHTDNTGTPAKNMELSKNRAESVRDYLIGQGVASSKIKSEWFGQEKPVADNKTAEGRQKNRRVEMKIVFD